MSPLSGTIPPPIKMKFERKERILSPILTGSKDSPKIYKPNKTEVFSVRPSTVLNESKLNELSKPTNKRFSVCTPAKTQPIVATDERPIT